MISRKMIAACLVAVLAPLGATAGEEAQAEPEAQPQTFTANVMIINSPTAAATGSSTARLRMTVDRWTTDEERVSLKTTLMEAGTPGLVSALEEITVGHLSVDQSLRWPIRVASMWETEEGRNFRLVTNRPVYIEESMRGTRSLDYPIGLIQFTIPNEGNGEGSLIGATRVQFNEEGRIAVESMPHNKGAQRMTGVRQEVPRSSRKKKNKSEETED